MKINRFVLPIFLVITIISFACSSSEGPHMQKEIPTTTYKSNYSVTVESPAEGSVLLKGVYFDMLANNKLRLILDLTGKSKYKINRINERKFDIILFDTVIDKELEKRHLPVEPNAPLKEVVLSQEDVNTIVELKLVQIVPYHISQVSNQLRIEFDPYIGKYSSKEGEGGTSQSQTLTKSLPKKFQPKKYKGQKISLDFHNADIQNVFRILSDISGMSIVVDEAVSGKVTLTLHEIPWDKALDVIVASNDLEMEKKDKVIYIRKRPEVSKLKTKIFEVNYLVAVSRKGETRFGSKVGDASHSISRSSIIDVWGQILSNINRIKSRKGKVIADKPSGIIMVTDLPERLDKIALYLETVENSIKRQVLIEAAIVEINLGDEFQLGINWEFLPNLTNGAIQLSQTASLAAGTQSNLTLNVFKNDISTIIKALNTKTHINLRSRPKIVTLNNQKAIIKAVTTEVWWEREVHLADDGTIAAVTYKANDLDVGIILELVPQVTSEGLINLAIHPTITEYLRDSVSPDELSTKPVVNVRETDTMLTVEDGQTIVIGGLIQDRTRDVISGPPCLIDIPFLGAVFRHTTQETQKVELAILMTPTILKSEDINRLATEEQEQLKKDQKKRHLGPHKEGIQREVEDFKAIFGK